MLCECGEKLKVLDTLTLSHVVKRARWCPSCDNTYVTEERRGEPSAYRTARTPGAAASDPLCGSIG